jgi:DNA-binding response OmpR family regulator
MKLLERQPPHLLFADDDQSTLDIYAAYIRTLEWTADYVKTARELIAQVNVNCVEGNRCFDALVCDVNFFDEHPDQGPRITGVTAAKVIRETHPDLPVVFVTGYSNYLIRDAVEHVGGAELFEKPVDFEQLFARIAYLIRWNRIALPPAFPNDRRTPGLFNQSGYYRRKSDVALEVPPVLENLITEVRETKRIRAVRDAAGH